MHKLFASLILLMGLYHVQAGVSAHERCADCHVKETPEIGDALLVLPLTDLCIACHDEKTGSGEHIVDVASPIAPPDLPLQSGLIGCPTCHDPHSTTPGQLRLSGDELCRSCHDL